MRSQPTPHREIKYTPKKIEFALNIIFDSIKGKHDIR